MGGEVPLGKLWKSTFFTIVPLEGPCGTAALMVIARVFQSLPRGNRSTGNALSNEKLQARQGGPGRPIQG